MRAKIIILTKLVGFVLRRPSVDAKTLVEQGKELGKKGDHRGAIELYDQALVLEQGYTEAFKFRGDAHWNLQQYDCSVENYDKAIEVLGVMIEDVKILGEYKNKLEA